MEHQDQYQVQDILLAVAEQILKMDQHLPKVQVELEAEELELKLDLVQLQEVVILVVVAVESIPAHMDKPLEQEVQES